MGSRLELQTLFETIIESRNVYFNPPESVKMSYPAIVYSRKSVENVHANNSIYKQNNSYQVILIDEDPESEFIDKILQLPMISYDRHYVSDNLNHDVFTLYY